MTVMDDLLSEFLTETNESLSVLDVELVHLEQNPNNPGLINNIFRLVQQMGVMTWSVFFLVPTGRGKVEDEVTPQEYEDVMNWRYDASKVISIKTTEGHHYKRIVIQRTILDQIWADPVKVMGLGQTYLTLRHRFLEVADLDKVRYAREVRTRRPPSRTRFL